MANDYFNFKQFKVVQDKCAMKVGTDGVLLGAWASSNYPQRILDVGTGTGLIALMLAQRFPSSVIDAIEIDFAAASQAQENIDNSKWRDRITVWQSDFLALEAVGSYDLIVSNPPYFENSLLSDNENRNTARHTNTLSFELLTTKASSLLKDSGNFVVVLPASASQRMCDMGMSVGLFLQEKKWVKTTPKKEAKRVLLSFCKQEVDVVESELIVELQRHVYSQEYIDLLRDFYLKF